ncbi:hypothetical protein F4813DRAFT_367724 [Daldinia decipiens]|uniref:uncharacterized protein n=1 Tax=Daldinia decipiens TaxID=326647 RepID=UPI0020C4BF69|nr:uncharacterized protein F4813DRAFT_367724 [Daldinia decipiens]KAI1655381.1 hypothetical protein F4813DRAFT_367724 [Daldinia decipiens]
MPESQPEDNRPAWARISFPSGWNSERFLNLTVQDFGQVSEDEQKHLKDSIRKFPFSQEYSKLSDLNKALREANKRPPTPPSYVPTGWTVNQARGLSLDLVTKLSDDEQRLWAAGKTADSARKAHQQGQLPAKPPSYIPTGWSVEQAIFPTFEILSQLSHQDLTTYMEARNQANMALSPNIASPPETHTVPSPLVKIHQRAGFPSWGFVIVRTYYASESRWEEFQERLGAICDKQLDEETGEDLEKIKEALEFKTIEDPRLEGVSAEEARKHFHIAKSMGGVAAGFELSVLLVVDARAVDSVLRDETEDHQTSYVTVVDVTEFSQEGGYQGHFKVSLDALLCEFYPKLSMGLSPRDLWSMMDKGDEIWIGDDE